MEYLSQLQVENLVLTHASKSFQQQTQATTVKWEESDVKLPKAMLRRGEGEKACPTRLVEH